MPELVDPSIMDDQGLPPDPFLQSRDQSGLPTDPFLQKSSGLSPLPPDPFTQSQNEQSGLPPDPFTQPPQEESVSEQEPLVPLTGKQNVVQPQYSTPEEARAAKMEEQIHQRSFTERLVEAWHRGSELQDLERQITSAKVSGDD